MKSTIKYIGMIIIVISLIAAVVYGGWIMVDFFAQMLAGNFGWEIFQTHLQGLMLVGGDLALLFLGYKAGKDYLKEYDVDETRSFE